MLNKINKYNHQKGTIFIFSLSRIKELNLIFNRANKPYLFYISEQLPVEKQLPVTYALPRMFNV